MTDDEFRYLWEAPTSRYVLIRIEGYPDEEAMIYDVDQRAVVLIDEDDDLHLRVVAKMRAAGFALVDQLPE